MQHKKVSKILSGLLDTFEKYGTRKNKLPSDAALPSTKGATAITGPSYPTPYYPPSIFPQLLPAFEEKSNIPYDCATCLTLA